MNKNLAIQLEAGASIATILCGALAVHIASSFIESISTVGAQTENYASSMFVSGIGWTMGVAIYLGFFRYVNNFWRIALLVSLSVSAVVAPVIFIACSAYIPIVGPFIGFIAGIASPTVATTISGVTGVLAKSTPVRSAPTHRVGR
jgi:hypothetical protein